MGKDTIVIAEDDTPDKGLKSALLIRFNHALVAVGSKFLGQSIAEVAPDALETRFVVNLAVRRLVLVKSLEGLLTAYLMGFNKLHMYFESTPLILLLDT